METETRVDMSRGKKVGTAGAIIAALTTIVVSAINVAPRLPWFQQSSAVASPAPPTRAEQQQWQIVGELSGSDSPDVPMDAEVVLIPAGSPFLTTTDAQGKFFFPEISPGGYWILIRHAESGLDARVLVDAKGVAESRSISLPGGAASMGISLEPQAN
jgi:hypothetical protein